VAGVKDEHAERLTPSFCLAVAIVNGGVALLLAELNAKHGNFSHLNTDCWVQAGCYFQ